MANINEVKNLIYNTFNINWDEPNIPYTKDNSRFETPSSSPWIRLTVRNRISNQETLGKKTNRKFLRSGSIYGQVFVPINTGTSEADRIAQKIRDIFEGERIDESVWITNSDVREVGPDGDWYQFLVESFFTYEETK